MQLDDAFRDFLTEIRPTSTQRSDLVHGHETLRNRLQQDPNLGPLIITTFLQGSYRRHTAVRPRGQERPDVDVVVVTTLDERAQSVADAMGRFKLFLSKHYAGKWGSQGRSFGIETARVDIDLVVTAAPPQNQWGWLSGFFNDPDDDRSTPNWSGGALRIPDRRGGFWEDTNPLAQIDWTERKNAATNGHFINVVKAIKWWRLEHANMLPKYPKGYPLERVVAEYCPNEIRSIAEGVTRTFEGIARQSSKPYLRDHGTSSDVLRQITPADWQKFWTGASAAGQIARRALNSTDTKDNHRLWRELFGTKFPNG